MKKTLIPLFLVSALALPAISKANFTYTPYTQQASPNYQNQGGYDNGQSQESYDYTGTDYGDQSYAQSDSSQQQSQQTDQYQSQQSQNTQSCAPQDDLSHQIEILTNRVNSLEARVDELESNQSPKK